MLNGKPAIKVGTALHDAPLAGGPAEPMEELELRPQDQVYDNQLSQIAGRLGTKANQQVTLKMPVEERWLRAVRLYHGKYDATFLAQLKAAGQSTAFVKAVRAKTVALEARLFDLMFPTDDRNWAISATPVPKLSDEKKEAEERATNAAAQATQMEADGQDTTAIIADGNDEAARAAAAADEIARCTRAAKLMQEEMDDQLVESKYPAEFRNGIHDFCQLGPMILKGPMVNEKTRGRWLPLDRPNGQPGAAEHEFELKQTEDKRPMVRRVDPWNFFPDMSARCIEECEFFFERYLWTATQLRQMVRTHGFDPMAVRELLREDRQKDKRSTNSPSLTNLVLLRSLTEDVESGSITGRYVGWEYHGPLERDEVCLLLRQMGREKDAEAYERDDDPLQELRVIVHFCDNVVLKIAPEWPMDSGEALYSMANLEEAEGQLFGYGIPTIAEDQQDALNSSWRMALDNGALSVGPQALVDKTAIQPADGKWVFSPRKIWQQIKTLTKDQGQPLQFFDVPNNMEELKLLIDLAVAFIDMETGIPQPQAGEEAKSTPTVGGMAILQSNGNILFRRFVKALDDGIITPTMRRLYDWNMQFSTKADIKGDMSVDARGTSVLLVKEVQAQNLMMVVSTLLAHPEIGPMIKAFPAVEKLFQSMMLKPSEMMITEDEYKKFVADRANQPPPPSPQEIQAQARIQAATVAAEASKLSDEMTLRIAELRERTALIDLAAKGDITLEQLQADLQKTKMNNDSKERMLVAEAAIDQKNAEDARARGEEPGGSGGAFNEGGEQKAA